MPQPNAPSYRISRRNRSRSPSRDRNTRRQSYRDKSRSRSRGSNENNTSSLRHTTSNKSDHHYKAQRHYDYDSNSNSRYDRHNRYETSKDSYNKYDHHKYDHKHDRYDKYDESRDRSSSSKSYHNDTRDKDRDKVHHHKRDRDISRRERERERSRNEEDKRRKSRFSHTSYSTRSSSRNNPTNIAILKGQIPSNYGAMHIENAVTKYHPSSICIIREGDTLLSDIKYILVRFENISSTISFVEDNEFKSGEFILSNSIKLSVNYHKVSSSGSNMNDIKALESDWLCSKCFYYNIYNRERKSKRHKCGREDCNGSLSMKCIRVDSATGNPYILGEIIVDKVKGNKINLKSCAVLAVEGIDVNTTDDVIRDSFKHIADIDYIYIVNKNECDYHGVSYKRGCVAFLQFKSPDLAKHALKQALLNHVTVSSLPINLAFIAYNNGHTHNNGSTNNQSNGDNTLNSNAYIQSTLAQQSTAVQHDSNNLSQWSNANVNNMNILIPKASDFGIADSFQWDATANCFYDANSGYYYDIHRNLYYFNGNFYEWNVSIMQYVQVQDPHAANEDANATNNEGDEESDVIMNNNDNDKETNEEDASAAAGPIKFGFKSQQKQNANDATQPNKKVNEAHKMNKNMELTDEQKEMMRDLPIMLQNKVSKFCNKEKLCCYLCRRKFKTFHDVCDHIKLSEYHLFNLSQWISAKRLEINHAAEKFYQSIAVNSSDNNNNNASSLMRKAQDINTNNAATNTASAASLQDKFLKMMSAYDNSRCDKSSDGGIRALMK